MERHVLFTWVVKFSDISQTCDTIKICPLTDRYTHINKASVVVSTATGVSRNTFCHDDTKPHSQAKTTPVAAGNQVTGWKTFLWQKTFRYNFIRLGAKSCLCHFGFCGHTHTYFQISTTFADLCVKQGDVWSDILLGSLFFFPLDVHFNVTLLAAQRKLPLQGFSISSCHFPVHLHGYI